MSKYDFIWFRKSPYIATILVLFVCFILYFKECAFKKVFFIHFCIKACQIGFILRILLSDHIREISETGKNRIPFFCFWSINLNICCFFFSINYVKLYQFGYYFLFLFYVFKYNIIDKNTILCQKIWMHKIKI